MTSYISVNDVMDHEEEVRKLEKEIELFKYRIRMVEILHKEKREDEKQEYKDFCDSLKVLVERQERFSTYLKLEIKVLFFTLISLVKLPFPFHHPSLSQRKKWKTHY